MVLLEPSTAPANSNAQRHIRASIKLPQIATCAPHDDDISEPYSVTAATSATTFVSLAHLVARILVGLYYE